MQFCIFLLFSYVDHEYDTSFEELPTDMMCAKFSWGWSCSSGFKFLCQDFHNSLFTALTEVRGPSNKFEFRLFKDALCKAWSSTSEEIEF